MTVSHDSQPPRLEFAEEWNDAIANECEMKEYCGFASVVLSSGRRVPVFFMTPLRIAQDVAWSQQSGDGWMIEARLIPLSAITRDKMEAATLAAWNDGFFDG